MLVAYPPGKTGKRKRIQLHFHLMQKTKPDKPDPPPAPTEGTEASGKSFPLNLCKFWVKRKEIWVWFFVFWILSDFFLDIGINDFCNFRHMIFGDIFRKKIWSWFGTLHYQPPFLAIVLDPTLWHSLQYFQTNKSEQNKWVRLLYCYFVLLLVMITTTIAQICRNVIWMNFESFF